MSETQYKLTSAESLESSIDFDFKKNSKENERLSLFNNSQPITTVKQHHQQSNSSVKSSLSDNSLNLTINSTIFDTRPKSTSYIAPPLQEQIPLSNSTKSTKSTKSYKTFDSLEISNQHFSPTNIESFHGKFWTSSTGSAKSPSYRSINSDASPIPALIPEIELTYEKDFSSEFSLRNSKWIWLAYTLGCLCSILLWYFSEVRFPWFIYPASVLTISMLVNFFNRRNKSLSLTAEEKKVNWFLLHLSIFLTVNCDILLSWSFLYNHHPLPWFVWPSLVTVILLMVHWSLCYFPQKKFLPHYIIFFGVNSIILFTWSQLKFHYLLVIYIVSAWAATLLVFTIAQYIRNKRANMESPKMLLPVPVPKKESDSVVVVVQPEVKPSYEIVAVAPQQYSSFPTLSKDLPPPKKFLSLPYKNQSNKDVEANKKYGTSKF